jgi:hypothetical protein
VLRSDNEHGKVSYGWIGEDKLLISSETAASWSVTPLVFEKLKRVAEDVAKELNMMLCTGHLTTCTCDEFKEALEIGVSGRIAEELIVIPKIGNAHYYLGNLAPSIKFCPFCGKKVKDIAPEEVSNG